jgi:hypothetical protein
MTRSKPSYLLKNQTYTDYANKFVRQRPAGFLWHISHSFQHLPPIWFSRQTAFQNICDRHAEANRTIADRLERSCVPLYLGEQHDGTTRIDLLAFVSFASRASPFKTFDATDGSCILEAAAGVSMERSTFSMLGR